MKLIATILAFAIAFIGSVGVVAPSNLLAYAQSIVEPPALYDCVVQHCSERARQRAEDDGGAVGDASSDGRTVH